MNNVAHHQNNGAKRLGRSHHAAISDKADYRTAGWASDRRRSGRTKTDFNNPPSCVKVEKTAPKSPLEMVASLPADATDVDVTTLLRSLHKGGIGLTDKNRVFKSLVEKTDLGKSDLNKLWKAVEQTARKSNLTDLTNFKGFPVVNQWGTEELVEYACKRLEDANNTKPFLFHFSDDMARLTTSQDGTVRIQTVNQAQFEHELNSVTKWSEIKTVGADEIERTAFCPSDVAKYIFNGPRTNLPPLRRLVTVPSFTKAKVLTPAGYQDGIYYHPQKGVSIPEIPQAPTNDQVGEAVHDLSDLFADFSLDGKTRNEFMQAIANGEEVASFAHLLSYGLSSIARELIEGPVPGHLGRKDKPRSGATLALTTMESIATCQPASIQTLPTKEEEIQKTITAIYREGASYAFFDNIKGGAEIESDALAAAMTAYPTYKGRLLGTSSIITVPAHAITGFTGNRSALSPQLAERMLLIEFDPKMENPGIRAVSSFKYSLPRDVKKDAGKYLGSLLMLVQNWISKGCPEWAGIPLGGFERHAAVIGGILDAAGVYGFMGNRDKLKALVKTNDPVDAFMDALIAEHCATAGSFRGTLFKVGSAQPALPSALKGHRIVSFADVLNDAQIPMRNFGYKELPDGEIFYPPASANKMAQNIVVVVGTVRDGEGETEGRWRLQVDPRSSSKTGKLYYLECLPA
ncbi:MAG: hypothetical protein ABJJ69_17330 [Paracoccaceae bacterium]